MIFSNVSIVNVYFVNEKEKRFVGRLILKNRKIFFEYHFEFIKTGLELSPFKLPLKPGVQTNEDRFFEGLFGVFNDSLPDGWGLLLLNRKLMKMNVNLDEFSPLDRLCYVGTRGMGALIYEPAESEINNIQLSEDIRYCHENLDGIANEVIQFQENDDDKFVDNLLIMSGSSAGARPKVVVNVDREGWIIKFRSSFDPKDIGLIEYAYHLMAKAAYLDVPEAKIFSSKKGPGYFGAKRFDRNDGKRVHMHTISGLLHVDHRVPNLDYQTIVKTTLWLTKDAGECEKQFRAAVFNVLSHNRDDHSKNFSFLMDENGRWRVSPAYDLTFSLGPGGEHCTMVMGEGKTPAIFHLLKLAIVGGIKERKALQIIDEVKTAVSKWGHFAKEVGVGSISQKMIQTILDNVSKNM